VGEIITPDSLGGIRVRRAGEITSPERVIVFGKPGAGKTPFLAACNRVAAFAPALFINLDTKDSPKSARTLYPELQYVDIKDMDALEKVYLGLWDLTPKCAPYRTIIVDGVTTAQLKGIEGILKGKSEGVDLSFINLRLPTMGNGGWNASKVQMAKFTDLFIKLADHGQAHLFFTAWESDDSKPPDKFGEVVPPYWVPSFTPSARDVVCGKLSSIIHLTRDEVTGRIKLECRNAKRSMVRDRDERLDEVIYEPTMAKLAKQWGLDDSPVNGGIPPYDWPGIK
jgi:hypothetical protein